MFSRKPQAKPAAVCQNSGNFLPQLPCERTRTCQDGSNEAAEITAISPADLAAVLSSAYRRKITEEQVRDVAKAGNLLAGDGTINLIQYAAFLAGEVGARWQLTRRA